MRFHIALFITLSPLFFSSQGLAETLRPVDLDCADFGSRELANRELSDTYEKYGSDIHRLDADRDGVACETLPSAQTWSFVAAGIGALAAISKSRGSGSSKGSLGVAFIATLFGAAAAWLLLTFIPRQTPAWLLAGGVGIAVFLALQKSTTVTRPQTLGSSGPPPPDPRPQPPRKNTTPATTVPASQRLKNQCECGAWLFPEEMHGRPGMRCSRIPECGRWYGS